ncbi:MAG: hypothetical protein ACREBR_04045, partial [bacterium]
ELAFGRYERFKTGDLNCYLCGVEEFGRSEGTYPPILEGCEHVGVIKSPNIGPHLEDTASLIFYGAVVDLLEKGIVGVCKGGTS